MILLYPQYYLARTSLTGQVRDGNMGDGLRLDYFRIDGFKDI